jgi:hypothetical protein
MEITQAQAMGCSQFFTWVDSGTIRPDNSALRA